MSFSLIVRFMILTIFLAGSAASLAVEEPNFTPLEARLYDHLTENLDDFVALLFDQDLSAHKNTTWTVQEKKRHLIDWFINGFLLPDHHILAQKSTELNLLASTGLETPEDVRIFALEYLEQEILAWRDSPKEMWIPSAQRALLLRTDSIAAETFYRAELDQWIYPRFTGLLGLNHAGAERPLAGDPGRYLIKIVFGSYFTRILMLNTNQYLAEQFQALGPDFFKLRFNDYNPVEFPISLLTAHIIDPTYLPIYVETVDAARDNLLPDTWAGVHDRYSSAQTGKQLYWTIGICNAGAWVPHDHHGETKARAFWDENHPGGFDAWLVMQCPA